jgi:hypothetical protein
MRSNLKPFDHRCLHGNLGQQAQHARYVELTTPAIFTGSYFPVLVYTLGNTIHRHPELPSTQHTPNETSKQNQLYSITFYRNTHPLILAFRVVTSNHLRLSLKEIS